MCFSECVAGTTGEAIADCILSQLESRQLSPSQLRGQTYDGAGAMAVQIINLIWQCVRPTEVLVGHDCTLKLIAWWITAPGWKRHSNLTYYVWAQGLLWFLAQYHRITPGRKGEKWMTMAFPLCTNIVVVHALACYSPAAEGFIPCGHESTRIHASFFVVNLVAADSAEIYKLEWFWL